MKPLFRIAFLALVMLLVAMVSALAAMRFAIHGQEVQVPAIVGMTPSEAERKLAGARPGDGRRAPVLQPANSRGKDHDATADAGN